MLLNDVKTSLRITHNGLDTDIQAMINACIDDLIRVGVNPSLMLDTNVRVIEACKLYVKGRIDYQGKGTLYFSAYENFRDSMKLDVNYIAEDN